MRTVMIIWVYSRLQWCVSSDNNRMERRRARANIQVAGNQVGLSSKFMNTMAGGYFVIRCLYSTWSPT